MLGGVQIFSLWSPFSLQGLGMGWDWADWWAVGGIGSVGGDGGSMGDGGVWFGGLVEQTCEWLEAGGVCPVPTDAESWGVAWGAGGLVGRGVSAFWRGQATGRGQAPLRGQATGRGQAPLRGQALLGLGLACWRGQASRPEVGARTCRGKTREGHTHCSGSSVLACCGPGMPGPYERRGCAFVGAGNALSAFKDIGVCSMGVVGWLQRPGGTGAVAWRSYGLVSRRQILSCIPIYINSPGNSGFLITCD